jgi:polygalacturonase
VERCSDGEIEDDVAEGAFVSRSRGRTFAVSAEGPAQTAGRRATPTAGWRDVREFGAEGDAKTDDTAAFQRALDEAGKAGGGTVYAPTGRYLFKGSLTVPGGVTLEGSFRCVPSHTGLRDKGQAKPGKMAQPSL